MADYGSQQGRDYGRPNQYGHATSTQRDAAFSSIFGAPPPGRSQTMTSPPPPLHAADRAQTMSSQTSDMMQRAPPMRQYQSNGYSQVPPGAGYSSQISNGGGPSPPPAQRQPPPQYLPQPLRPDRRPYGLPQRVEPNRGPVPPGSQAFGQSKPIPNRMYPGAPGMNGDAYRSQSLATTQRPAFTPPSNSYNPNQAFRQPLHMNHHARTTAQGRVVPERPDERTMSMTSHAINHDFSQTMSGRVIPPRRRESGGPDGSTSPSGSSYGPPTPSSPVHKGRTSSQGSIPSRTMSQATTIQDGRSDSMSTQRTGKSAASTMASQQQALMVQQRRQPLVYPALLSRVAEAFRERIPLGEKEKDGLSYKNAFTGAEGVDLLAYIIKTADRNLALLLGRSLDAQKFFHEVTYSHRLRDSQMEVYQFKETLMEEASTEVNGVFTLLTECYSPTCTRDRVCYSIACPRRLEQQARLNMRPNRVLKREESRSSLHEDQTDEQKLWINTVSKEVAESVDEKERKRQEVISELMYTERDFVKDLEYLRDYWMKPLRSTNPASPSPIPEHRREKFVRTVFSNCQEVYMVNSRFAEALTRRQQQSPIVYEVGDIFLEYVPRFSPFVKYGANQLFGKHEFEKEKASNAAFARFVDEVERLKESRKLELNGYLTKPTTRLARYPLLLENIEKFTAEDNPDRKNIPEAIRMIKEFLSKVNIESGKAENQFNLMQLNTMLKWRPGEYQDLKLTEEGRQLLFKGSLKRGPTDNGDINAYLFDHAVLLVRVKTVNKREELKVYRKPIPLELLVISQMDEVIPRMGIAKRPSSSLIPGNNPPKTDNSKQQVFPITFKHLGRGGYELTLYCTTQVQRRKWIEHIDAQQRSVRERNNVFTKTILNEGFFIAGMRVNCCVPIDGGRKLVFGTDVGVYVSDRKPKDASMKPKRVLDCKAVTQIDVLEQHQILLILSDKTMYSYSMEALDENDSNAAMAKRGRKISHANFFKVGVCVGQHLVCCVKTSALSSTIKVFEPMDSMAKGKKKSGFAKMLQGGQEVLKPYKEFYIPSEATSIHFLRSKLCVGCTKGFEIVSLETLETQPLLDQADTSLDFVVRRENIKPIYIERLATEFLLCYSDFSFFVNKNGWRARPDWRITWEGNPQAFAIFNPYILAFEPSFIEIRHMETGMLIHILTAKNVRMLHSSTREILYAYEDEVGEDVIASLDFWGRPQEKEAR